MLCTDINNIVTILWSDYRRGLDWELDLLKAYRSQLQVTIALSLIHALGSSLRHALNLSSLLCLHQWTFPCSRSHVLAGWRPSHTNLLLF
jgi:hypothetical protein